MAPFATGGIFQLVTNDGKQDIMLMASALSHKRFNIIESQNNFLKNIDRYKRKRTFWDRIKTFFWGHKKYQSIDFDPKKNKEIHIKEISDIYRYLSLDDVGLPINQLDIELNEPPPEYDDNPLNPPLPDYYDNYEHINPLDYNE